MKKFIKLLALVMALLMSLTCFIACSDETEVDDKEEKTENVGEKEKTAKKEKTKEEIEAEAKKTAEEESTKVVKGYMDGLLKEISSLDEIEKNISGYVAKDSEAYEEMQEELEGLGSLSDLLGEVENTDSIMELLAEVYNMNSKNTTYEIKDTTIQGKNKKARIVVCIKSPDEESGKNVESERMSMFMQYLQDKGISITDIMADDKTKISTVMEFLDENSEELTGMIFEGLESAKKKSTNEIFIVEEIDGKWLITDIKDDEDIDNVKD